MTDTPKASPPANTVMVPREPTEAMKRAGADAAFRADSHGDHWIARASAAWTAMIVAAPHSPPSRDQGEVERLRAALKQIEIGARRGLQTFVEQAKGKRSLNWRIVNTLQDTLEACAGHARVTLNAPQDAGEITLPRSGGCAAQGSAQSYGASSTPGKEG
jgi:hypothetical protein